LKNHPGPFSFPSNAVAPIPSGRHGALKGDSTCFGAGRIEELLRGRSEVCAYSSVPGGDAGDSRGSRGAVGLARLFGAWIGGSCSRVRFASPQRRRRLRCAAGWMPPLRMRAPYRWSLDNWLHAGGSSCGTSESH
jgi:hypothetical protein